MSSLPPPLNPLPHAGGRLIRPRDGELDGFGERGPGVAGGEGAEGVDGALGVGAGAGERVVEGAAVAKQPGRVGELVVAAPAALDRLAPEAAIGLGAAREGEDDRERHLAVAEIVAGVL